MSIFVDLTISQILEDPQTILNNDYSAKKRNAISSTTWKPRDNIVGITQIIDSFIRGYKASWRNIDACLSVSLSALKEPVLQRAAGLYSRKDDKG